MSQADNSVKIWRNLPINNPKPIRKWKTDSQTDVRLNDEQMDCRTDTWQGIKKRKKKKKKGGVLYEAMIPYLPWIFKQYKSLTYLKKKMEKQIVLTTWCCM